jgi:hypothetical protein
LRFIPKEKFNAILIHANKHPHSHLVTELTKRLPETEEKKLNKWIEQYQNEEINDEELEPFLESYVNLEALQPERIEDWWTRKEILIAEDKRLILHSDFLVRLEETKAKFKELKKKVPSEAVVELEGKIFSLEFKFNELSDLAKR